MEIQRIKDFADEHKGAVNCVQNFHVVLVGLSQIHRSLKKKFAKIIKIKFNTTKIKNAKTKVKKERVNKKKEKKLDFIVRIFVQIFHLPKINQ